MTGIIMGTKNYTRKYCRIYASVLYQFFPDQKLVQLWSLFQKRARNIKKNNNWGVIV